MNTPKRFKFLSVLCATVFGMSTASAETLQEIYLQAQQNDHQLRAAAATRDAGQEDANLARARLLPQVNAQASWRQEDPTLYGGSKTDGEIETVSSGISLTQSLINVSNWRTYSAGKASALGADATYAQAEQELIVRTAQAYFDALNAVDNLTTAKAEEDALSHQLEQTKQRFEVGLTAITEVHEAQAAYDSATANRLVAAGRLGIAFEALEVITGQPYESLSPLREKFPVASPEPLERKAWESMALENNAALKTARQNMLAAEATAKASRAAHLPTVSASLGYSDVEVEQALAPEKVELGLTGNNRESDGMSVQVQLSLPIFTGGATSASRRQAYSRFLAAKELYLKAKRDTVQATRSNHLAVLTSVATVKARKQAITSSTSALEATQAGYDVGTRDLVDVLNAQRNLYTAQRDYYSALYTYVLSTLQLRQAAGVLTSDQVAELDGWLDKTNVVTYQR